MDNVVSSLVRAAIGGNTEIIDDADLDRYVAGVLASESKAVKGRYEKAGLQAYTLEDERKSRKLRPNKRFLAAVVRNTDDHNRSLLRQTQGEASRSFGTQEASSKKVIRGRGSIGGSRLDKFFEPGYNPRLDFDNYDDSSLHHYISALEEVSEKQKKTTEKKSKEKRKSKKKKKKKKKKGSKDKRYRSTSSSSASSSDE
ncbi:hypothetical protein HDV05_003522 [Chytridiales sp. JEL 0842]|nr:hypothetical protein HDV05_003522 [Chytridiales sp. JEL 0842]